MLSAELSQCRCNPQSDRYSCLLIHVCSGNGRISVCAFSGLSRYKQDKHFTSKPVNYIAQTNTTRNGLKASLNSLPSSRFSIFARWGRISRFHFLKVCISFCSWLMTTAISVSCIHFSLRDSSIASC